MRVYAPNKNCTGVSASVTLCNGTGEINDSCLLNWLRDHGYEVETPEPEAQEPEAAEKSEKRAAEKADE